MRSNAVFSAALALTALAIYVSYMIPTILLFIKRSRGHRTSFGPFKLGKYCLPVNLSVHLYYPPLFPLALSLTGINMNCTGPVFDLILVFAALDWVCRERYRFYGPLREVGGECSSCLEGGSRTFFGQRSL